MLVRRENREEGKETRGRWRGLTFATWEGHKTSVCTCKDALGRNRHTYIHAYAMQTYTQGHTCRKSETLASYMQSVN